MRARGSQPRACARKRTESTVGESLTYFIDSWAWIEYFRPTVAGQKVKSVIDGGHELVTSTTVLAEVYYKFLAEVGERAADEATAFMKKKAVVLPLDEETAKQAAGIKKREKLALADAFALAACRKAGARMLTGDPDFKKLDEVEYVGK